MITEIVDIDGSLDKYIVLERNKKENIGYVTIRNINTNEVIEILCSKCKKIDN